MGVIVKAEGPSGPAKIRSDDPKHALGLVQYLRTIGYSAWVEDTNGNEIPEKALKMAIRSGHEDAPSARRSSPPRIRRRSFSKCDQAASLSLPSAKNGRALEWTHCFSPSLITPALCRQSAFMTIRAADAASLIGKINSTSHARCMAE